MMKQTKNNREQWNPICCGKQVLLGLIKIKYTSKVVSWWELFSWAILSGLLDCLNRVSTLFANCVPHDFLIFLFYCYLCFPKQSQYCPLGQVYFLGHWTSAGSIRQNIVPREYMTRCELYWWYQSRSDNKILYLK